ncbi:MAG: NAD(P)/FAD-dependent oxidoreductase, partial [Ktedonobacterales bacterium]|nr:NAD(P)/FAD-dependent oxidoreductase [Ktedonobacterales bacterium]
RCRRRVLLCDAGHPRNERSHALHCYLTRDGIAPAELLRLARADLRPYETIASRTVEVTGITREEDGSFGVALSGEERQRGRKLLLATGVNDDWPELPGAVEMYGKSIHHCPYCDGWEWRDAPVAVYGKGEEAAELALELTRWTRDIALCGDGPASIEPKARERLTHHGIPIREARIICLEGTDGYLERVVFAEGEPLARRALFFSAPQHQRSIFPAQLGCEFTSDGAVKTDMNEATCVPGLYVAGDASRRAQFAIVAAAEGVLAAEAINSALLKEDLARADAALH